MNRQDLDRITKSGDWSLLAATAGTLLSALSDAEGTLRDLVHAIDASQAESEGGPYVKVAWIVNELAEARYLVTKL